MFEIRGKCVICTQPYVTNNISALHCGHIFHYDCILQWLKCSSTCPICRVFNSSEQIVKHLFFDDGNDYNNSSLLSASRNSQVCELRLAEEKLRELENSREALIQELKNKYSLAVSLAEREFLTINKLLDEKENFSAKIEEMDRTLETFLTIQKRQLDDARNLQSKLKEELREEREQLRFSKKKEVELENRVKSLERVLRDVRATWEKPLKQRLRPRNTATTYNNEKLSRRYKVGRSIARKNKKTFGGQEERLEDANSVD